MRAPAKLTVTLRITGVEPDGYHLIDAEMVTLDLVDELELSEGDGLEAAQDDLAVAASLGADVPFCLVGGRARVTGVGEVVEPLPFEDRTFTLAIPPIRVSTPDVYKVWDDLGGPAGPNGNDLEPAALLVAPDLSHWRNGLAEATGQTPRLAGSGGTWFVEGEFPGEDRIVVRTVPAAD
jgi:4-diphosphocytidyl-2-C-methyl-D-erythritol kinase